MSAVMFLRNNLAPATKGQVHHLALRALSTVPSERKADFAPRVISKGTFPDVKTLKLRRGTGGRSSFNGMIVTVFGATGVLGRSLINSLGKIGSQVIVPYRGEAYATKELKLAGDLGQILFVPYYLRDLDSVHRALKHSNVVVNLIGRDTETPNFDFESIHTEWPRTLGKICTELGIPRLVHVSALNSSPDPARYYMKTGSKWLKTKYAGELAIREEYPDTTIFRPAEMYGEMDKYLWYYCRYTRRRYRKLGLPNGGYDITKTPVSVSDVAAGIVNAITDEESIGKTFDAVGPRRYELRMLMEYLQDVIMKDPDNGFKINNLDWDLYMRARISFFTKMSQYLFRDTRVSWERIEREAISDETPKNPTLSDLGVRLQYVEDLWPYFLQLWRFDYSYDGDLGEKKLFTNPPYIHE